MKGASGCLYHRRSRCVVSFSSCRQHVFIPAPDACRKVQVHDEQNDGNWRQRQTATDDNGEYKRDAALTIQLNPSYRD
jgi:hypothetical protein